MSALVCPFHVNRRWPCSTGVLLRFGAGVHLPGEKPEVLGEWTWDGEWLTFWGVAYVMSDGVGTSMSISEDIRPSRKSHTKDNDFVLLCFCSSNALLDPIDCPCLIPKMKHRIFSPRVGFPLSSLVRHPFSCSLGQILGPTPFLELFLIHFNTLSNH